MSSTPPLLPVAPMPKPRAGKKWKLTCAGLALAFIVLLICGYFLFRSVIATGITRGFDNQFGDQHLKTAVALIELHKLRNGRYPDSLRDLQFQGGWDPLALNSVSYYPNPARTAYLPRSESRMDRQTRLADASGILAGHRVFGGTEAGFAMSSDRR